MNPTSPARSRPEPVERPHLFGLLAGLALAAALVLTALVFANAWTRISESQVISVTGSARRNVRSDLVVWRASFSVEAPTLIEAQQKLRADHAKVAAYFQRRGIEGFVTSPVQIRELVAKMRNDDDDTVTNVRIGYRLTHAIEVRSEDIERLPRLAGDSGELLQEGVAFESGGFEFIYTKAGEAKVEMMADATRDARERAERIAASGGGQVSALRSARMGVVQINPLHSSATSWEGNNDTSAVDKTITATVTATFALR
ncbi:MAG TPA: SIMPL domain-containing protein [Lacunisphaera sp.]|nr:SIMPL domain-containing protein [Lacunisphaera sp.]